MRACSFWLVLTGSLMVLSGVASAAEQKMLRPTPLGPGMEADTNRFGADYRNFEAANPQQCQAACAKEAQCKAWTWVKPGVQGPNAKCWLKNAVPAKSANACCISGVNTQAPGVAALPPKAIAPVQPNAAPAPGAGQQAARIGQGAPSAQAIAPVQPKAAPVPGGNEQALRSAPGPQSLAQRKAPLARAAPLSAPIRINNVQAQQSQQRFMNNVRQQNALADSTYNALLTEQGAESLVQHGVIKPEVLTINGQRPKGVVLRPGQEFVILGHGLGTGGQLQVLGDFRKPVGVIVIDWRPRVIRARLADDISGEEENEVRLSVQPSGREAIHVPGLRFEAIPEVTMLKEIPQRYVSLPGFTPAYSIYSTGKDVPICVRGLRCPPDQDYSALVRRETYTNMGNDTWFDPGTDVYSLPLKPGFAIHHYFFYPGRSDTNSESCDIYFPEILSGGQYFKGRYEATLEGNNVIKVQWGVWRCHVSPDAIEGIHASNTNASGYVLDVYVVGPRGASPWK
jgi:hypothetical protein